MDWSGIQEGNHPAAPKDLDAVLFLDCDGVLHPIDAGDNIETEEDLRLVLTRLPHLRHVVEATKCHIVLSSTWRKGIISVGSGMQVDASFGSTKRQLKFRKLCEELGGLLVSKTPAHPEPCHRPDEIMAWVERFRCKRWVAVDDEPVNLEGLPAGHVVQPLATVGLTAADAEKIIEQLRGQ
jgi:hypothetical protein